MADHSRQVFISYQRTDVEFALLVRDHLAAHGVQTWMDQFDIPVGAYWSDEIDKGLASSDIVVGILSPDAVESRNVKNEWDWAIQNDKPLFLVQHRPCVIPHRYVSINFIDAIGDPASALDALLALPALQMDPQPDMRRHSTPRLGHIAPQLAGRDQELAQLRDLFAATEGGVGGLVLIGGEAGIGKTTLVSAMTRDAADHGAVVLIGSCYDLMTTPPYGPWVELARLPPHDLPVPTLLRRDGVIPIGSSQQTLFDEVTDFFAALARIHPIVVVLEDLHWADGATLDLLRHLARTLRGQPVLLVATYRDDELTRHHPLYPLLPLLVREASAERLQLQPLGRDALHDLVVARYLLEPDDRIRLSGYLAERSDGNPFFATELLRTLEDERLLVHGDGQWHLVSDDKAQVPTLVRQMIETRLARLDAGARTLVEVAAVIGQDVPLDLWSAATGATDEVLVDAIEQAVTASLFSPVDSDTHVRFPHALVREALVKGLLSLRRRPLHRQIADALARLPGAEPDAVAYHYQQAGDPRAFDWLILAGERAQRAYALTAAIERLAAAAQLVEHDPARITEHAWLLYRIGRLHRTSNLPAAIAYVEQAEVLAAQSGDGILQAFVAFDVGHLHAYLGRFDHGNRLMRASIGALEAIPVAEFVQRPGVARWVADIPLGPEPNDDRSGLQGLSSVADLRRGTLALFLSAAGDFDATWEMAEPYIQHLITAQRPPAVESSFADLCIGLGRAYLERGEVQRGRELLELAVRSLEVINHFWMLGGVLSEILREITLVHDVLDVNVRQSAMTRIGEVLHRAGISDALPFWLGQALLLEGRWQELSRGVGPIMDAIAGTNPWMWKALLWLPALQGDVDVTEQQIRFVLPRGQDTQPGSVHYDSAMAVISVAARMELGRGWIAAARAWLEMHDRWITWAGDARSRSFGALLWAEYFRASGDPEEARQRAERSLELAADLHQPLVVLAAQRLLGELDTAAGLTIEATSWLSQSLELATACAAPFERALTLLALAELRAAEGNRDEARMLIDEVRSICESLGARPTLARVDVLVEQIESAPVSYPAGLTAREVDVLRLIAQGLTDADVAEQLFIARRTVNTHLTSIYTKLSVSSRAAATRFAVEHGLT